jgi:hypothetical protein
MRYSGSARTACSGRSQIHPQCGSISEKQDIRKEQDNGQFAKRQKKRYITKWEFVMATEQLIPEWKTIADEIWAILRETSRRQEETAQRYEETTRGYEEIRRLQQETRRLQEETAQQMKETDRRMKETDRRMKETDRRLGKLTNRFGEVVEYMIVPNLVTKFRELGFEFEKTHRDTEIVDRKHDIILEVDAFLENGDKVMIVEIKSKPNIDDVNYQIEKMEKLRTYADLKGDNRKYLGAIGGVVFSESEKTYALKNGFYVIEPSGDTFNITEPKGKYHPREW